jgi:hypothetical protein
MYPGDEEYGRLLDEIARCTATTPVSDGLSPRDMLDQLRRVRRRIVDYRKRHDELPYERRACLKAAVTTIDHACHELNRLKQIPEVMR